MRREDCGLQADLGAKDERDREPYQRILESRLISNGGRGPLPRSAGGRCPPRLNLPAVSYLFPKIYDVVSVAHEVEACASLTLENDPRG